MWLLRDARNDRPISVARYFTVNGAVQDLANLRIRVARGERPDLVEVADHAYVDFEDD